MTAEQRAKICKRFMRTLGMAVVAAILSGIMTLILK